MPEPLRDTVHTNNAEQVESESLPEEMNLPINNDVGPTTSHPKHPNQSRETILPDIALEKRLYQKHTITSSFTSYMQNQH